MASIPPPPYGSSSSFSLPSRITSSYPHHTQLHNSILPLLDASERAHRTQELLYTLKGRLTSKRAAYDHNETRLRKVEETYRSLRPKMGLSKLMPASRRRKLQDVEAQRSEKQGLRSTLQEEVERLSEAVEMEEDRLREAQQDGEKLAVLEKELDKLDESLFAGPTPGCTAEDKAEQAVLVARETRRFLLAESDREKRSRTKLLASLPSFQKVLTQLRSALSITLDAGVPTNTKYTRQLFVNGSPVIVARSVSPLVLAAKTESGKGTTLYAEARGSQLLVRPLPVLVLMDLNRLPVKGGAVSTSSSGATVPVTEQMSESSMHSSLEASYAQVQAQVAHVKREIMRSRWRSDFFRRKAEELDGDARRFWLYLREVRREIVLAVARDGLGLGEADERVRRAQEMNEEEGELEWGDEVTLSGDTEEEIRRATGVALDEDEDDDDGEVEGEGEEEEDDATAAGGGAAAARTAPVQPVATRSAPLPRQHHHHLIPPSLTRNDSALTNASSGGEDGPAYIRNPHLSSNGNGDDKAAADSLPSPLDGKLITAKSTRALRRIMRKCVKETNAKQGGAGADDGEDAPTFWDMS